MTQVTKGLVIADPWIGYILDGSKTWERRSTETSMRGSFALIRKGTNAVWGVATLANIGWRLSPQEMIETIHLHRIPAEMIRSGEVEKWNVPWILTEVRRLERPVPYDHPNGAVTWVNLDEDVSRAIAAQLSGMAKTAPPAAADTFIVVDAKDGKKLASFVREREQPVYDCSLDARDQGGSLIAQVDLTEGNIRHNHFYLRGHVHRFPSDVVGGSNKTERAKKEAIIDWAGSSPAVTDIDGEKQFFRARGWIKQFFELNGARPGDRVLVEETGPYRYRVSLKKA